MTIEKIKVELFVAQQTTSIFPGNDFLSPHFTAVSFYSRDEKKPFRNLFRKVVFDINNVIGLH